MKGMKKYFAIQHKNYFTIFSIFRFLVDVEIQFNRIIEANLQHLNSLLSFHRGSC